MPDEFWKERLRDASRGKPPFDPAFAPPGYRAVLNDKPWPTHPCIDCDFRHIRVIDCGLGCKKPFEFKHISCCAFARPDKQTVHFKEGLP